MAFERPRSRTYSANVTRYWKKANASSNDAASNRTNARSFATDTSRAVSAAPGGAPPSAELDEPAATEPGVSPAGSAARASVPKARDESASPRNSQKNDWSARIPAMAGPAAKPALVARRWNAYDVTRRGEATRLAMSAPDAGW